MDAIRVSQVRSITFASGDLNRYAGTGNGTTPGATVSSSGTNEGTGTSRPSSAQSAPPSSTLPSRSASGHSDGPSPLGVVQFMEEHARNNTSGSSGGSFDAPHHIQSTAAFSPLSRSERAAHPDAVDGGRFTDEEEQRRHSVDGFDGPKVPTTDSNRPTFAVSIPSQNNTDQPQSIPSFPLSEPTETLNTPTPSTYPALAFTTDEQLLAKYTALFLFLRHCSHAAASDRDGGASGAGFLSVTERGLFTSALATTRGYREWVDVAIMNKTKSTSATVSKNANHDASTIRVFVTPRTRDSTVQDTPEHSTMTVDSSERGSDASTPVRLGQNRSTAAAIENRSQTTKHGNNDMEFDAEAFFDNNTQSTIFSVLIRDCITDFPRLLHVLIAASRWSVSQRVAVDAIIGKRRGSTNSQSATQLAQSVNNKTVSTAVVPPLSGWSSTPPPIPNNVTLLGSSTKAGPLSNQMPASSPRFLVALRLAESFLQLFEGEQPIANLDCASNEGNARLQISFRNLRDRWPSAMDQLHTVSTQTDDSSTIFARPSRSTIVHHGGNALVSGAMPVILPSEELLNLAWEWSKLASAVVENPMTNSNTPPSPGVVHLFTIAYHTTLRLEVCGPTCIFAFPDPTRNVHGGTSLRYSLHQHGNDVLGMSNSNNTHVPSTELSTSESGGSSHAAILGGNQYLFAVFGVALIFSVGTAIGNAFGESGPRSSAAQATSLISLVLSVVAVVYGVVFAIAFHQKTKARSIGLWAGDVVCSVTTLLFAHMDSVGGSQSSPKRTEFSTMNVVGGGGSHAGIPQAPSVQSVSTYAVSSPSPMPSQSASVSEFFVKAGNQTPIGVPLPSSNPTGSSIKASSQMDAAASGKKPNPLTAEAFQACATTAIFGEDDDNSIIHVRMDPTGTFLIPFLENEPILLDGVHVHRHLAVMGVEFTRPLNTSSDHDTSSASATLKGTTANNDSIMIGDEVQDEDRYAVCMWNLAMSEVTGGYASNQVVDQTLSQVVSDTESYNRLLQTIRRCEDTFAMTDATEAIAEPIVIHVVHKELGSRAIRVTVSPVVREEEGSVAPLCIGVLVVGVPVDAQVQQRAFGFRNLFLSEAVDDCIVQNKRNNMQTMQKLAISPGASPRASTTGAAAGTPNNIVFTKPPLGVARATSPTASDAVVSPPSDSLSAVGCYSKLADIRRVNEFFVRKAIQDFSALCAINDSAWKAVYANFIPGMLCKSFSRYPLRVRVEATVPSIVEANITAVTSIVDQVLNTIPQQLPSVAALGTSIRSNSSTRSGNVLSAHAGSSETNAIHISFGLVQEDAVAMYCRIENVPLDRYLDLLLRDIDMEEATGVPAPAGSAVHLIRSAEAIVCVVDNNSNAAVQTNSHPAASALDGGAADMVNTGEAAVLLDRPSSASRAASKLSANNTPNNTPLFPTRSSIHGVAGNYSTATLIVYFPYRAQTGAKSAISAWDTRDKKVGPATPQASGTPSADVSLRDVPSMASPSKQGLSHTMSNLGNNVVVDLAPVLSVMIDLQNELDRQKYTRRFWEDHHSVFPVDAGKFLSRGLKLLRSHCRTFDAVVVDFPAQVSAEEFEKKMEEVAKEFPETTFLLLRLKRRMKTVSSIGAPPLHPKSSAALMEKKPSALISFMAAPEQKPKNLHVIPAVGTLRGIGELVQYVMARVKEVREEAQRKQHLQQLFREHRTGPWTRGKKLGRGTFGDVYEACLSLTGGKMAVKVIRLPSSDPQRLEQLINEVEILAKVQHPNIVQYFYCEAGQSAGEVNVFMELCPGGSLQAKCQSLKPIDVTLMSGWIQQLCSALAYLHRNHLAHRDIKPANILLSESGSVKIADFGTAAAVSVPLREVAGTFAYMAPEVYAGNDYGTPCDIWSVGCVLLDLLGKQTCSQIVGVAGGGVGGGYFCECANDDEMWKRIETHVTDAVLVDFLRGCFRLDPLQRSTAEQLLLHPFLSLRLRQSSPPGQVGVGGLSVRRSSPNLTRKSHESSVGVLSVDSGEFGRRSTRTVNDDVANNDGDDDDSSDDGWGDLVRVDDDSDNEEGSQAAASATQKSSSTMMGRSADTGRGPFAAVGKLDVAALSTNAFTPRKHNTPSPPSTKALIAESPSTTHRRRQLQQQQSLIPSSSASPAFATHAAALARRQSNVALRSDATESSTSANSAVGL